MAIAWGLLCPLAIAASMLRDFFPPGMFFQIHRAVNSLVVGLTLIAFSLALRATNIENLDHFADEPHRKLGLVIFIFAFVQALNGALRPHATEPGEEKKTVRLGWEIGHRAFGLLTLILSWVNCNTGLERYFLKFDSGSDDEDKLRVIFWIFAAGISGIAFVTFVATKSMGGGEEPAPPKDAEAQTPNEVET